MAKNLNDSISEFVFLISAGIFCFAQNPYFLVVMVIEIYIFYTWLWLPTLTVKKLTNDLNEKETKDIEGFIT